MPSRNKSLCPAHDVYAAVAMRLNLQDRGFGLGQGALFGTHHGIPVVKPNAKIGTIGCWLLVPIGDVYGVAMPVRSCARKAEGEQSRQRNQKKEVASRHGVLPWLYRRHRRGLVTCYPAP